MSTLPKLDGYMPEPLKTEHWTNDRLKAGLLLEVGSTVGDFWNDLGPADLRPFSSPLQDQRKLGSCVAQSAVKALELKRIRKYALAAKANGVKDWLKAGHAEHRDLSALQLYFSARSKMTPRRNHEDSGTHISTACDALRKIGVCLEETWPYDERRFADTPSLRALREAYLHKIDSFHRIVSSGADRVTDILLHLHAGNPVIYGTALSKSFMSTGKDDVVGACNGRVVGRHAMCIVAWLPDHKGGCFVVENSWGVKFGHDGFFYASPEHITDPNAQDLWTITGGWEPWAPK